MKYLYIILVSFAFIVGCDEENITPQEQHENPIYGTWKLTETYGSINGIAKWTTVDNGYIYTFRNNEIYTSTRFSKCTSDTYILKDSLLSINFSCDGFSLDSEDYLFEWSNNTLILSPKNIGCEECRYQFVKIPTVN